MGTPAELLGRAVAEACRRHRAPVRDITVAVSPAAEPSAPARLTITTPVPVSLDGCPSVAGRATPLLRDIETIPTDSAPEGWRRVTDDGRPADA